MTIIEKATNIYICTKCLRLIAGDNYVTVSYNSFGDQKLSDGRSWNVYSPDVKINIFKCPICNEYIYSPVLHATFEWGKYYAKILDRVELRRRKSEDHANYLNRNYFRRVEIKPVPEEEKIFEDAPSILSLNIQEIDEALDLGIIKNKEDELYERTKFWWLLSDLHETYENSVVDSVNKYLVTAAKNEKDQIKNHLRRKISFLSVGFSNCPFIEDEYSDDFIKIKKISKNIDSLEQCNIIKEKNISILLNILPDDKPENILIKGEMYRHLGRFTESIKTLETVQFDYEWISSQIINLAKSGNRRVQRLTCPGRPFLSQV